MSQVPASASKTSLIWPCAIGGALVATIGAVCGWHWFLTRPVPFGMDDSSSPFGNMLVFFIVIVSILFFIAMGSLIGSVTGWLSRVCPCIVIGLVLGGASHLLVFATLWYSPSQRLLLIELREDEMHLMLHHGELSEVENEVRMLLDAKTRFLGSDHLVTLLSHDDLAYVLEKQGKMKEAENVIRTVLTMRERILGAGNGATLWTRELFARFLENQGAFAAAETEWKALLAYDEPSCGEDHKRTLADRHRLAACLRSQKKQAEEESQLRAILKHDEVIDNSREKVEQFETCAELARCLRGQGRLDEAKAFAHRAIAGFTHAKLGADRYQRQIRSLRGEFALGNE